jgi:DNA-binding transcriptional regulator/RsmH inhibitor MraZ
MVNNEGNQRLPWTEAYPFLGVYEHNNRGIHYKLDSADRITIPAGLRTILDYRERLKNPVSEKPLLYVSTSATSDIPYLLITDSPLEVEVNRNTVVPRTGDNKGRFDISIFKKKAGINGEIVFQGSVDHIKVYSVENWKKYSESDSK